MPPHHGIQKLDERAVTPCRPPHKMTPFLKRVFALCHGKRTARPDGSPRHQKKTARQIVFKFSVKKPLIPCRETCPEPSANASRSNSIPMNISTITTRKIQPPTSVQMPYTNGRPLSEVAYSTIPPQKPRAARTVFIFLGSRACHESKHMTTLF